MDGAARGLRIVVGGPARRAGKTTLVCALVRALSERRWTAVKVTADDHGQPKPLWEETVPNARKGTGRYLDAGAERAFLLTSPAEGVELGPLWTAIEAGRDVIFESNRIVGELKRDLTLALMGSGDAAKPSFAPFLEQADAILAADAASLRSQARAGQRLFQTTAQEPLPRELLVWVRSVLRF